MTIPREKWPEYFADVEKVNELLPKEFPYDPGDITHDCLVAVYDKQTKMYAACYKLCEIKLANEAWTLVRTMFETWLLLQKFAQSEAPAHFAEDWLAWGFINDKVRLLSILKRHPEQENNPIMIKQREIQESKVENTKIRLGNDYLETKAICPQCGYESINKRTKWDKFKWKGPALAGPTQLAAELGEPLREHYNEISSVSHSYDIHSYAAKNFLVQDVVDNTPDVMREMVIWMVNSYEIIREHVLIGTNETWEQLNDIRNRILKGQ